MDLDDGAQDFGDEQQRDISRDNAKDQAGAAQKLNRDDRMDEPSWQTDRTKKRSGLSKRKHTVEQRVRNKHDPKTQAQKKSRIGSGGKINHHGPLPMALHSNNLIGRNGSRRITPGIANVRKHRRDLSVVEPPGEARHGRSSRSRSSGRTL